MPLEPEPCQYVIFQATLIDPAEYCEGDAVEGEDYCSAHLPWVFDD